MYNQENYEEFHRKLRVMQTVVSALPSTVAKPAVNNAFRKFGRLYVGDLQKSMNKGRSNDSIGKRSGALSRAFSHVVKDGVLTIMVDSTVSKYWKVQEFGAQGANAIKAKPGKALAIPVGPALTPAGVAKYKSPRDVPDLTMLTFKDKNTGRSLKHPVLGKMEDNKFVVYFVLVKKVEVKPRLGMRDLWYEKLPQVLPMVQEEIHKKLVEVKRV